jgi:radical SAM protein with 4Fe4S-binding SPASM domain
MTFALIIFYIAPIEQKDKMALGEKEFNNIIRDYLQFLTCEKMFNSIKGSMPQPRYVSCGALKRGNYCIDSDGGLVKCEHYIGNSLKKCGSIFDGPNYKSTEVALCCLPIEDKCGSCSIYPVCRGGCAQRRLDKKINVECKELKDRIKMYLYFLSKGLS